MTNQIQLTDMIQDFSYMAPETVASVTFEHPGYISVMFNDGHEIMFGDMNGTEDGYRWNEFINGLEINNGLFDEMPTAFDNARMFWMQYQVTMMDDNQFNMHHVADILIQQGIPTRVEMTGGNCATIYCGTADEEGYYQACAGPGSFEYSGLPFSVGDVEDFCVGSDKDSDIVISYKGECDEAAIAQFIADFYIKATA